MNRRIRFPQLILLVVFVCLQAGCGERPQTSTSVSGDQNRVAGTVQLEIDFQSDRDKLTVDVPCSVDSTVFTILERAQNLGDLKFKATGKSNPATTFVSSIGGVDNLAGAGDNWTFRVNGVLGDKGAAMFAVKPGDTVAWVFGKYELDLPKSP